MNKTDLINDVAEVVGAKKEARKAVEFILSAITEALKNDEPVTLVGFGSFKTVQRKARQGRNPRTGEEIRIAARKTARFTPGKALKEALN